jgi:hypothetical protein
MKGNYVGYQEAIQLDSIIINRTNSSGNYTHFITFWTLFAKLGNAAQT